LDDMLGAYIITAVYKILLLCFYEERRHTQVQVYYCSQLVRCGGYIIINIRYSRRFKVGSTDDTVTDVEMLVRRRVLYSAYLSVPWPTY
jgi:hypothetical protein